MIRSKYYFVLLALISSLSQANCDLIFALNKIDISKLDKAKVLQVLYKRASHQGFGYVVDTVDSLSYEQAQKLLKFTTKFEYLGGRLLKIDLAENTLDTFFYNQSNGAEAAEKAICEFFHSSVHYPSHNNHLGLEAATASGFQ